MLENALFGGDFNPVHEAHIKCIDGALQFAEQVSVSVSYKKRIYKLPLDVRRKAVQLLIDKHGLNDRVLIVESNRLDYPRYEEYKAIVVGSDVINKCVSIDNEFYNRHFTYFNAFSHLIIAERPGYPLDEHFSEKFEGKQFDVFKTNIDPSSKEIRARIRNNELTGIDSDVWELIRPHVGIFHNEAEYLSQFREKYGFDLYTFKD